VLILREASTYWEGTSHGRYQLPGGRIETGEAFFDALQREVSEETGLSVEPLYPLYVGEWRPVIKGVQNQIIAMFVLCKTQGGDIELSEEHDEGLWIEPEGYAKHDLMPPDDKVIEAYIERKKD
jgi:8-oxo-dGTP pyrophosphatase MutT (NUDIX family)